MILNGYDTSVGSRFRIKDKVTDTLKILQSTDRLEIIDDRGVYAITHKNDAGLPPFIFPMSFQNYMREKITVMDQRPYFNKSGQNVNLPEYNVMFLATCLQQDLQNGQTTLMKTARPCTIKAFANAMSRSLARGVQLDVRSQTVLKIILAYYFVCLLEGPIPELTYVAKNSIRSALPFSINDIGDVIDAMGYVGTLADLHKVITTHPELFSLSRLDLSGLIQAGGGIFFAPSGYRQIVQAALEMPTLFTAFCWGAATQKLYQNTLIGEELNPKNYPKVDAFVKSVGYYLNAR